VLFHIPSFEFFPQAYLFLSVFFCSENKHKLDKTLCLPKIKSNLTGRQGKKKKSSINTLAAILLGKLQSNSILGSWR